MIAMIILAIITTVSIHVNNETATILVTIITKMILIRVYNNVRTVMMCLFVSSLERGAMLLEGKRRDASDQIPE